VTSEGQIDVLRKRRVSFGGGRLTTWKSRRGTMRLFLENYGRSMDRKNRRRTADKKLSREAREVENTLAQEKEHLERARNDA